MKKVRPIWVTGIVFCLLSACYFTDDSLYEVDPVAGDPPVVSVITNLDTMELPTVNDSLQVIYDLSIENGQFFFMEALVTEGMVHTSDSASGSFWIYPFQSQINDIDTLRLDFYHSSNTNTLADLTGYEARITRLKYAIDFNQGPP
jgi:hypothetical protein